MTVEWPGCRAVSLVDALARTERLLVALDFDGTLAPLVNEPMSARATPSAAAVVAVLNDVADTRVAFVSGRSLRDLREIAEHGDDSGIVLAGSHGAEYWLPGTGELEPDDAPADVALRDALRTHATRATAHLDGVWIEPKTFGLGVHTRRADEASAASANEIVDALVRAEAPHWRRRTGHSIVEYSFRHEGKDSAIAHLRERFAATAVLFAGDDITDEDALRSLVPGDLGVRVGAGETAGRVRVAGIPALVVLLEHLAAERAAVRE